MAWISSSWLAPSWVGDWFGEGNPTSPRWLGDNWFRPGYIASNYLTNQGHAPTSLFAGDTLSVSISDAVATPRVMKVAVTDNCLISLSETFSLTYTRHVVAFDTLTVTFGEQQQSLVVLTREDDLDLTVDEIETLGGGEFLVIEVSDDLDIEVDDPGINQGIEAGDTLDIEVEGTNETALFLERTDTLDIGIEEATSLTFTGAFAKSTSDTLSLSLVETPTLGIFATKLATDSLDVVFTEEALREFGVITTYLQLSDTLSVGLDEVGGVSATTDTEAKNASDNLNLSLSDSALRRDLLFFTVGDTLNVALVETATLGKTSRDLTWDEADFPWGGTSLKDIKPLPIFCHGFDFYQVDSADSFVGNVGIQVVLERLGLTIYGRDRQGNWKEDPDVTKLVKKLIPIFRGVKGTVINIYVGAQDDMEEGVTWDGPHPFVIGEDRFITPLISGKFIGVRFESLGQKQWSLLSYELDITKVGRGL